MGKNLVTVSIGAVALAVGAAIGFLIATSGPKITFNPLVIVGPDAATLRPKDKIPLSYKNKDQMTWRSDSGQPLVIVFPVKGVPPAPIAPFAHMTEVKDTEGHDDWVFQTHFSSNAEVSTPINPALEPSLNKLSDGEGIDFKYDQILDTQRKDGWIIIKK